MKEINRRRVLGVGLAVALLMLIALNAAALVGAARFIASIDSFASSLSTLRQMETLLSTLVDAENSQRGYLLTQDLTFLAAYQEALEEVPSETQQLQALTAADPVQRDRFAQLQPLIAAELAELAAEIPAGRAPPVRPAAGAPPMVQIRRLLSEMESQENVRLATRLAATRSDLQFSLIVFAGGNGAGLLLLYGVFWQLRRDLDARQRAEAEARRSEQKLRALLDIAPVGISTLDEHRQIREVNSALERILDISQEKLLAGAYAGRRYIRADGTPLAASDLPTARALATRSVVNEEEVGVVKEDGAVVWTSVSVAPLDFPDVSAVIVTRDITARKQAEAALAQQIAHLDTLYRLSQRISANLELEAVCAAAHTAAAELMPAEVFIVSLLDEAQGMVDDVYLSDRAGRAPNRRQPAGAGHGLAATVIATNAPLRLADWDAATAQRLGAGTFGDGVDTRSHLTVPMHVRGRVIGALGVQDYQPQVYTAAQEQLLHTLAGQVASALETARLIQSLREGELRYQNLLTDARRQAQELELLDVVRSALAREMGLAELLRTVVEAISRTFGYTLVSAYMVETGRLVLQHQVGYEQVLTEIPLASGVTGRALRTGQPMLVEDVTADPDFVGAIEGILSEVCVPLFDQGQAAGVLNVESTRGIRLTQQDLRLIQALGESVTVALGRARLYTDLRESEERFRQLAENVKQVFWLTTPDQGRVFYISPAYETIWGRSCQSMYDNPYSFLEAIHPEDRPRVAAAQGKKPTGDYAEEYRVVRPDGSVRWVYARAFPIRDAHGEVYRVAGISEDVTERKAADDSLEQFADDMAALYNASQQISASLDLEQVYAATHQAAGRLMPAEVFMIALLDEPQQEIEFAYLWDAGRRWPAERAPAGTGLAGYIIRTGEPLLENNWSEAQTAATNATLFGAGADTHSVLAVPLLRSARRAIGALSVQSYQAGVYTPNHEQLLRTLANQVSIAIENARLFRESKRMAERQTVLYEILRTVGAQLDPDVAATAAVEVISRLGRWANVVIGLPEGEGWVAAAAGGYAAGAVGRRFALEEGVIGRVFRTGMRQMVSDVARDPNYVSGNDSIRSELAVPIRRGGRLLAVLNLESEHPYGFSLEDTSLAESLADAIALALDNAALYDQISSERSRLQALIESSRDGVVLVGMERNVLVINAPVVQMLGLPGAPQDYIGRPLAESWQVLRHSAPVVVRDTLREMRRIVRGDEPAGEGEYEVPPRVVHWLNLPVLAGAVPVGRLLVLRDVTEQRAVERLRDDLTHTMVHDLRNPLSGISTSLALFDFDSLDSTQRELLTIAAQSADRMLGLVNAILDVSRLESGQMPLERAAVDADLLAAEAVRLQTALAAERRLQLQNAVPAGLPAVNVDPTLIGRVLQNLIGNAIKFTPAGGRVTLNARRAGSRLEMSVSDTGPGIAPELLGKLFQKFVTGHEKERGSGLGLAFCRLAVEAHGGRLSVESAPERGTTFRFTLPLAESEAPLP